MARCFFSVFHLFYELKKKTYYLEFKLFSILLLVLQNTTVPVAPPRERLAQQAAVLATESVHVNVSTKPSTNVFHSNQNHHNNNNNNSVTTQPYSATKPASVAGSGQMSSNGSSPAVIDIPIGLPSTATVPTNPGMRTIELSTGRVREGFGKTNYFRNYSWKLIFSYK